LGDQVRQKRISFLLIFSLQTLNAAAFQDSTQNVLSEPAPGIHKIQIDAREIFDEKEKVPFAGLVNFLHVRTKKHVIRQELLFHRGDKFDRQLVDETERNLRALGIFTDVEITAHPSPNDSVALLVTTRDKWTTRLHTSYKVVGGVHFFGVSLIEDNLLGLGKTIDLGYNQSTDRILRQILYKDRRLFGTRFASHIKAQNNSDFDAFVFTFSRPFFAWNARWGFGFGYESTTGVYRQFQDGELIAQPRLNEKSGQLVLNLYRGQKTKRHLMFGLNIEKSEIGANTREINLIGFGLGWMRRSFHKLRNIDVYGRTEDVPSGVLSEFAFGLNYNRKKRTLDDPYFLYRFRLANATPGELKFSLSASFQTFYDRRRLRDTFWQSEFKAFKIFGRHVLVSRVQFTRISNFSVEKQLRLGDENGLRGFKLRGRTGTKMLLLNFEDRIYTNLKLLVFRLGLTAFVDVGNAWEEHERVRLNDLKASFGLGLRIGNARFTGAINRIDFAYNTFEKKWRVSVSIGSYFSAYTRLDFLSDFQTNRLRADL
jgi:outer membrane protein assembly factor BamA